MPESEGGFKVFRLGDLFDGQTGDVDLQKSDINGWGEYFINSGMQKCGIKGRTNRQAKVFEANTITIDFFGNAYYRPFRYKMATHNHVFSLSGDVLKNEKVGLYIVSQMSYLRKVFSYSNMGTWPKIKEQVVSLPINNQGDIDYHYMEAYIDYIYEECDTRLNEFLNANGFSDCTLTAKEQQALNKMDSGNVQMIDITIKEIFSVVKGKRLTKDNMIPGSTNFIGASATENGITNRISNNEYIHSGNQITVTYNGSVGESFYQPFPFWASDDVNVLYPNEELSENQCLYFLAPLRKKGKRYGYAFKWAKEIMEQDTVCLPIDSDYSIDYDFMEIYINALKKQYIARLKVSNVLTHNRIITTQTKLTEENKILILDTSSVPISDRFTRFLPLYSIKAACGPHEFNYSEEGLDNDLGWIDASKFGHRLNKNMFVVKAVGHSMEPRIKDGDYCVFEWYTPDNAGSREGKIVLAKDITESDDEYSVRFTIKRYHRVSDCLVELQSINAGHPTFALEPNGEYENGNPVLAVFVDTL